MPEYPEYISSNSRLDGCSESRQTDDIKQNEVGRFNFEGYCFDPKDQV